MFSTSSVPSNTLYIFFQSFQPTFLYSSCLWNVVLIAHHFNHTHVNNLNNYLSITATSVIVSCYPDTTEQKPEAATQFIRLEPLQVHGDWLYLSFQTIPTTFTFLSLSLCWDMVLGNYINWPPCLSVLFILCALIIVKIFCYFLHLLRKQNFPPWCWGGNLLLFDFWRCNTRWLFPASFLTHLNKVLSLPVTSPCRVHYHIQIWVKGK